MKKRRVLLLTLLALLLVLGIPTGFLAHEYRQERLNRDLIEAIKAEDIGRALAALKAGANPNTRDHSEDKPLSFGEYMKQFGDRFLNSKVKPEPDKHYTALMLCLINPERQVYTDNPALFTALLDAGADPNATAGADQTFPLLLAATRFTSRSFRLLVVRGANVHQKNNRGWTPLHWKISQGNGEEVDLLLNAGANIKEKDEHGRTLMHWACLSHNLAAIEALLRHHAAMNERDDWGKTSLDDAWWSNPEGMVPAEQINLIEQMRKAGARTSKELDAEAKQ